MKELELKLVLDVLHVDKIVMPKSAKGTKKMAATKDAGGYVEGAILRVYLENFL